MPSTIRVILAEDGGQTYTARVRNESVAGEALQAPLLSAPVVPQPNNPNTGIVTIPTANPLAEGTTYHLTIEDNADAYIYGSGYFVYRDNATLEGQPTAAEARASFDLFRSGDKIEHQQDSTLTNILTGLVTTTLRKILP